MKWALSSPTAPKIVNAALQHSLEAAARHQRR
jgi:hypothetical protein